MQINVAAARGEVQKLPIFQGAKLHDGQAGDQPEMAGIDGQDRVA